MSTARPSTARASTARSTARRPARPAEPAAPAAEVPDIIRALGDEHRYQARLLNLLERQVGLLNQRQTPDYEAMYGVMRYMTQFPDRLHHPKEDLVFEKIVLRDKTAAPKVKHLLQAHKDIVDKGARLLEAIEHCRKGDAQADTHVLRKSAHAYIGALRRHMDIEHLHMFPLAQQVLKAQDWADVDARMKPILDPVFEAEPAGDFKALREAEEAKPEPVQPGRLTAGLIEAAALIEAVATLIAGASNIRKGVSQHHRDALRANRDIWRELVRLLPLDERVRLTTELFERNIEMFTEFNQRIADQWAQVWNAAWKPYEDSGGGYTPKLLRRRRKPAAAKAAATRT
jgi:hemerythrin-like domain-containing protein